MRQVLEVNSYDRTRQDYDCSTVWEAPPMDANGDGGMIADRIHSMSTTPPSRRCSRCSEPLEANGKSNQSELCKTCRRKEQNHRAYLRRKQKKQEQSPTCKSNPQARGKPRS